MKIRIYAFIMTACDFACAGLHRTERHLQQLRAWAWVRATRENLKTCNVRQSARL